MKIVLSLMLVALLSANAADFYVSLDGDDNHDGRSEAAAFASVQKGVDALAPGDTLTILPGEYYGAVYREDLGADGVTTTIRAQIPGTVVLRGDLPGLQFAPVDGSQYLFAADFAYDGEVEALIEWDSLTIMDSLPNRAGLTFAPGQFYHDREDRKLYLSSPDLRSPEGRLYSAAVTPSQGFHLSRATEVIVDGIGVTGFTRDELAPRHERSQYATWGMLLVNSRDCVIRRCQVWLNGGGIMINSTDPASGDNLVEDCRAWGNGSRYGSGDRGGLTIFNGRRDVIRDSLAFRNTSYGANIRGEADGYPPQLPDGSYDFAWENQSWIVRTIAWGNGHADFKIKTGYPNIHRIDRSVGGYPGGSDDLTSSLVKVFREPLDDDTIILSLIDDVDPDSEFADPLNWDYRLQATSRFRGAGPYGTDKGPYFYESTLYFVSPEGDDEADGRSIAHAWQTVEHALANLQAGDTLYIEPGTYDVAGAVLGGVQGDLPVTVRGRGNGEVVLQGRPRIVGEIALEVTRLTFANGLDLNGCRQVTLTECVVEGPLTGQGLGGFRLTQSSLHHGPLRLQATSRIHLAGNIFDGAVEVDRKSQLEYADYNLFTQVPPAGLAGRYSTVANLPTATAVAGTFGEIVGPRQEQPAPVHTVRVMGPWVRSVTATTANIEWRTAGPTHPADASSQHPSLEIHWGTGEELDQNAHRQAHRFGDFSLTELQPDTEYRLRVTFYRDIEPPPVEGAIIAADNRSVTIGFRTAATTREPLVYHVSPDGVDNQDGLSHATAWATIQHAADQVGPGDTVLVHGGTYSESVRIRATGTAERPITFKAAPGEKVQLDGLGRTLEFGFFAANKSHLRFDGFYFVGFRHGTEIAPYSDFDGRNGGFVLYHSDDVQVTRCFMDGRGNASSPSLMHARHCADLLVENCVMLNCMGRLDIYWNSPRAVVRHNVFLRNFITHFGSHIWVRKPGDQCIFEYNILTDNLRKKVHIGLDMGSNNRHNCFYLRGPAAERTWNQREETTFADMLAELGEDDQTLVANPQFAATVEQPQLNDEGEPVYWAPWLIMKQDLDFPDLFATNPELTEHGIGLQPEAFADFHFNQTD